MFFTPVKVPVKVYLSTDKDAPRLDRTPNCVATILKACLVTGYGDKAGAGWGLQEDNQQGVKVLMPSAGPYLPFCLHLSNDTGREMTVQVYGQMSDIDTGDVWLKSATPFKYGVHNETGGQWAIIASNQSVLMLCQTGNKIDAHQSGAWLLAGNTAQNTQGEQGIVLWHTGGHWGLSDAERYEITHPEPSAKSGGATSPLIWANHRAHTAKASSLFTGIEKLSENLLLSPLVALAGGEVYALPFLIPSCVLFGNYHVIHQGDRRFMVHSTSTWRANNVLVPMDYWEH